jgi:hypothetical protein
METLKIKIPWKYYLIKYNQTKNKIKTITKSKKMETLKEQIKGTLIGPNYELVLLKLSKEPKFKPDNKTGLGKLIGGPIKITLKIYELTEHSVLKPKYSLVLNKKGEPDPDKRNAQFLFITNEYYQSKGIIQSDLEKVALLAIQNKLEKRPLAPKLIDQIY